MNSSVSVQCQFVLHVFHRKKYKRRPRGASFNYRPAGFGKRKVQASLSSADYDFKCAAMDCADGADFEAEEEDIENVDVEVCIFSSFRRY